jgi:hypothetical protein
MTSATTHDTHVTRDTTHATHLLRVKVPIGDVLASDCEDLDIAAEAAVLTEREERNREKVKRGK